MKYSASKFLIGLALLGVWMSPLLAQSITVTATIDRTRIELNGTFTLSVEVSGGGAGEPKLPPMDQFAALVGTSSSQNIQFINGRMSSSRTTHYTFIARAVGKFEIGAVEVESGSKVYRSQPIHIEIVPSATAPQQPGAPSAPSRQRPQARVTPGSGSALFLKAEVSGRKVYQNQPVIVSYKIYTLRNVRNYAVTKSPNFSGFWVEEFPLQRQPQTHYEIINGQRYLVAELRRVALFPQTAGKATIDPMTIACEVDAPRRRRPRDFFDSFFDDPFFGRTVRQEISSGAADIEVLPLPSAGKPANFSGAVGNFRLKASVDRRDLKTNEAVTLKVTASGQGNIKTLRAPRVELPPDFEVYEPKVSESINHRDRQISGSRTWEYVMVPRYPGQHQIKPIVFSFFDPAKGQYRTASTQAIVLNVTAGAEDYVAATGALSKEDVKLLGKDIRFISLAPVPFRTIGSKIYLRTWFLILLVLPVVAFAGALLYQRHQAKLATNVAYARSRKATRMAHKQLHAAKKRLNANDSKGFYAEVQRALMGFLGNKLNVAEAGLVTDDIEQLLKKKNVPEESIAAYLDCLHTCDYQRFSPVETNGAEMKQFYDKAHRALEELEDAI